MKKYVVDDEWNVWNGIRDNFTVGYIMRYKWLSMRLLDGASEFLVSKKKNPPVTVKELQEKKRIGLIIKY